MQLLQHLAGCRRAAHVTRTNARKLGNKPWHDDAGIYKALIAIIDLLRLQQRNAHFNSAETTQQKPQGQTAATVWRASPAR
ncbi:MAG: hypothetical protein ACI80M_001451 [Gammaproteobacteria bacterium]